MTVIRCLPIHRRYTPVLPDKEAIIMDYEIGGKPLPDILSDYRQWRSQQEDRIGTHSERCHLYHRDCMIVRLAAEVERLRQVLLQKNDGTQTGGE